MDDDTLDGLVENSMDLGAGVRQVSGEEMARDQVALSEALGGVVLFADATGYELGAQVKTQLVTASRSGVRQSYGDNATMRGVALGHGAAVPGSARPLLRALRAASE
jgi:hypothetical protein